MQKTLTVLRNERATYEVHLELGTPPKKFVGGQALDMGRLATELRQHGCSEETTAQLLQDVQNEGRGTVSLQQ